MHVFAVVLLVFSFGALGAYLAIRAMNGSKVLALMGAIGYCLLPWVTMPVFFAGAFDNLGFVIYPYVIMAIFARRWTLYYLFITLLCLINIPYAYLAMAIGLVTALFFKAKTQGFAAILIGLIVTVFDIILVRKSLSGIYTAAMPGYHKLLSCMVLNHEPLLRAIAYHFSYTTELFFTVAFLPFTCIYAFKRWNLSMLGLLALAGAGCFLGIFRSYYWFNHRAAGMVVPIYLSGFFAYIFIKNRDFYIKRFKVKAHVLAGIALFAAVTSVIFWFSWQYPWAQARHLIRSNNFSNISGIGKVYILRQSPNNERFSFVLSKAREFIPPKASVVYRVDSGIEAFFANRQMAWQAGNHPDGAEYYIIQLKAIEFIRDDSHGKPGNYDPESS